MLSSYRATYPFIKTTRLISTDEGEQYITTESEQGLITIDQDTVIVEDQEYSLKSKKGKQTEAFLNIESGKLISISIKFLDGEKLYFIDPEHSLFSNTYQHNISNPHNQHHIFSC